MKHMKRNRITVMNNVAWWLIGGFIAFCPKGLNPALADTYRGLEQVPRPQCSALQLLHCICAAEALKCTFELGMHKGEGRYQ